MPAKTILVIDDDPDIHFFCKSLLEAEGYRVRSAISGATGLAAAEAEMPDLIILDIMMEKINTGYKVAEALGGKVPILMFSSMLNPSDAQFDPAQVPFTDVISKPIAGETLLAKVRALIG
ncbi:MAG TPA: response regulator [Candidatus Hydrogenedentes bacterium]|jgi:DNA-binding response OmpR family regulator|nr:response regulator [Candidatus Hydrogenedentota bacterium]OQC06961.1 MAG: Alkaline phosphatase synthesis transcriptional regulatory protein PhoP [Candidatus Hydrogenedentes bacterium ADurb.Bin101]HOC67276.1 response regulator [Candidatus Hydrogenedentota bacterium]HQM99433.1 response regulator [Candidatus Hydrogenedentota bacterium]